MLLKVVFDKTAISNNFKENTDITHSKQTKIHRKVHTGPPYGFLKSQEKKSANQKSREFSQMFVISQKKTIP
jgi:hypothetical protein